jgi:predicted MFS family arabinose efflux permease
MATAARVLPLIALAAAVIGVATTAGSLVGGRLEQREQIRQLDADIELQSQLLRSEIERHKP